MYDAERCVSMKKTSIVPRKPNIKSVHIVFSKQTHLAVACSLVTQCFAEI